MTVPPLCQTSRDHRRMMIVILRMIVLATGRVGETAISAGLRPRILLRTEKFDCPLLRAGRAGFGTMHLQNAP